MMIRFVLPIVVLLAMGLLGKALLEMGKQFGIKRRIRRQADPVAYDFEPKPEQLYRRIKAVSVAGEDREAILAFVESRSGVEAFVEPRTLMYPLSVVLVAEDGEWARFELRDDAFIRELASKAGLPVYDATKIGYPERMRRYRKGDGSGEGDV